MDVNALVEHVALVSGKIHYHEHFGELIPDYVLGSDQTGWWSDSIKVAHARVLQKWKTNGFPFAKVEQYLMNLIMLLSQFSD